ncbi:response regulator transcription factor [Dactylosporangium sp. NPDC049140]|uniref:response regulator transcription factor n=1 Tax=Dactylosporangium sp. NPDC049140 TaxID=3155647 RepID=UPI0033F5DAD5
MIRVVLADDQAMMRAGLRALLEESDDIRVVGEAADGHEAVRRTAELRPEVVVMDVRMPALDGIEATRAIRADARIAGVGILIVTTFELDEYIFAALRAGAGGFVVKDNEPDDLLRAVRAVAGGASMLAPSVTGRVVREFAAHARDRPPSGTLDRLTEREREVMALAAQGLSNHQIAGRLYLSVATVKTHLSRLMAKLGARDRSHVVVIAYESGLVRPGWTSRGAARGRTG